MNFNCELPELTMRERDLQKAVVDWMQYHGWRAIRMNSGMRPTTRKGKPSMMRFGEPGMPDYLFLFYLDGGRALTLWVEFKRLGLDPRCTCKVKAGRMVRCTPCSQRDWRLKESVTSRQRSQIRRVDDLDQFKAWYGSKYYGLHMEPELRRPQEAKR